MRYRRFIKKPRLRRKNSISLSQDSDVSESQIVPADNIMHLQRTIGNQAVQTIFNSGVIQTKLNIGKPVDKYEQEADRVADTVMSKPESKEHGTWRMGMQTQNIEQETIGRGQKFLDSNGKTIQNQTESHSIVHQSSPLQVSRQGLLTAGEETAAINFNNRRYDERSIRILQIITGTNVDGIFGRVSAEAVAAFQDANGLAVDGKVGENTLDVMVADRVAAGRHEHAIQLVVDFHNLDVTSETLTVHFDPTLGLFGLAFGATDFESGNLRVIRLGSLAFLSANILRATIEAQLAVPAPGVALVGPRPTRLNNAQELAAIRFNRRRFRDRRSVLAIQGLVGAGLDGIFGRDTVERIAEFQDTNGLTVDGKVGEETLQEMVGQLDARNEQNAAIRLIIDFFNMSEHGALLDIFFDPALAANASTAGDIPGPSIVRIGPRAFARGFADVVHAIAHELEHVRQRKEGILSRPVREFLAEAIEILSVGMPEEILVNFMSDARRALRFWNLMTVDEQRTHWARFVEVRNKVRQRFNDASAAEQATHQATMNAYNAVVQLPPGP